MTLVYGVVDPGRDELVLVNAGHPPPVVLRRDGAAEQLPVRRRAPARHRRGDARVDGGRASVPGDTLVAFTDGLIERRDEDIDHGQRASSSRSPAWRTARCAAALEDLVESCATTPATTTSPCVVARRDEVGRAS